MVKLEIKEPSDLEKAVEELSSLKKDSLVIVEQPERDVIMKYEHIDSTHDSNSIGIVGDLALVFEEGKLPIKNRLYGIYLKIGDNLLTGQDAVNDLCASYFGLAVEYYAMHEKIKEYTKELEST